MKGDVDDDQLAFLAEQVATGKGLILLTHHQGLDDAAARRRPAATRRSSPASRPIAWVMARGTGTGGTSTPATSTPMTSHPLAAGAPATAGSRWGRARGLERSAGIRWHEQTPSTIGSHRVTNGFALLTLHGDRLDERFVDETGAVTYTVPDA